MKNPFKKISVFFFIFSLFLTACGNTAVPASSSGSTAASSARNLSVSSASAETASSAADTAVTPSAAPEPISAESIEPSVSPSPTPAAAQSTENTPASSNGKIIVLDPGHSAVMPDGSEPIGPGSDEYKPADATGTHGDASGLTEYQLTLQIAMQLRSELQNRGYTVYLTREDSESAHSCSERANVANTCHADVFLRIHADGSDSSSASGASAICITPSNPYQASNYSSCRSLSDCILNTYCSETGIASRGVIEEDNMTGNNWSSVPTTLIEMGFMTNPQEDLQMASADFQTVIVHALADGIDQYCGL